MAINTPNDPRRATPGDDFRRDTPLSSELQADPELAEGPASGGRIAIYAVAIVVLLGAVFYGLNSGSGPTTTATNPSSTTTTASDSRPAIPPNVRDVTPNREPGTTTGAAPAAPSTSSQATSPAAAPAQSTPPQSNPTGTEVDRSKGAETR